MRRPNATGFGDRESSAFFHKITCHKCVRMPRREYLGLRNSRRPLTLAGLAALLLTNVHVLRIVYITVWWPLACYSMFARDSVKDVQIWRVSL